MKKNIFIFILCSLAILAPTKKVFNVEGMMCGYGCVNTISKTLESINGVESYVVSYEESKMEIIFDDKNIDIEFVISSLPNPYKATFLNEYIIKRYAVAGITCMGCVENIQNSLKDKDGLIVYDIDYENKILLLEYVKEVTTAEKILDLVPSKFKLSDQSF